MLDPLRPRPELERRTICIPPSVASVERIRALAPPGRRPVAVELPEAGPGLWHILAVRTVGWRDARLEVDVLRLVPPLSPLALR